MRELVLREVRLGHTVIGEFGQAYWLDKRHGFSPTSSHTYTPEFFESATILVQPIHTFGVAKAYDTKVGTHTFLTQMQEGHPLTDKLKLLEFGTSTGRQRMVGCADAVEKGDALRWRIPGPDDQQAGCADLVGRMDGRPKACASPTRPRTAALRAMFPATRPYASQPPVFESYPRPRTFQIVRHFADPPANARRYVGAVRGHSDTAYDGESRPAQLPNLRYLGVGPGTSQIIKDVPSTADLARLA